jgi:hypothetical protein
MKKKNDEDVLIHEPPDANRKIVLSSNSNPIREHA